MSIQVNEIASLVEGVDKFKEYRRKSYERYFSAEAEFEAYAKEIAGRPRTALEQNKFDALRAQHDMLEHLTDTLDYIWYGLFGQTDSEGANP